jgi:hypothetical protein
MSPSARIQQAFVIFVLLVQVIWIANHMRWVANDQINPWKLGGYAMYTVPFSKGRIDISRVSPSGETGPLDPNITYKFVEFKRSVERANPGRVFRCAPLEPTSLRVFFEENPLLRGVNLVFILSQTRFSRAPVAMHEHEQGRVQIQWIGDSDLVYASQFCGNVETGEISWQ